MRLGRPVTETAISSSNPNTIIVRGHDLAQELIGQLTFTEHIWLLIAGKLPSLAQRSVLDATLVAIAEHGLVPSVVVSRMTLASAPEALQGAVAAGLLGCGSVILGASADAGRFFTEIREAARASTLESAIETVVRSYRDNKRTIPGYGHGLHKDVDPRAARLFEHSKTANLFGEFCKIAYAVETALPGLVNRPLKMNVSSAIPAVLLDADFPLLALRGVPLLARTASLIGHLLEEQSRPIGFTMAHAASEVIKYVGPAPEGFVPGDE